MITELTKGVWIMSRQFEVQVEIAPCTQKQERPLLLTLKHEWGSWETLTTVLLKKRLVIRGYKYLSGGQSCEESHEELRALLPPRKRVVTKWLCRDELEWDEVCGDFLLR